MSSEGSSKQISGRIEEEQQRREGDPIKMNRLPGELLLAIFELVDHAAAKKLRLVCKLFADMGARLVFKEIYASHHHFHFENLQNLANHPVFCNYVQTINYLGQFLQVSSTRSTFTFGPERPRKRKFVLNLIQQEFSLINSGEDISKLCEAIGHFKCLNDVRIIKTDELRAVTRHEAKDTGVQISESTPTSAPLLRTLHMHTGLLLQEIIDYDTNDPRATRPLAAILLGLAKSGRSIEHFQCDIPWQFWLPLTVDSPEYRYSVPFYPQVHAGIKTAFSTVRAMDLHMWIESMGSYHTTNSPIFQLVEFFSAAPLLEYLSLELDYDEEPEIDDDWDEYDNQISEVFSRVSWPHLKELHISGCKTAGKPFIEFMKRHAPTLESLSLYMVSLSDSWTFDMDDQEDEEQPCLPGAWEDAVTTLAPLMKLGYVIIEAPRDAKVVAMESLGVRSWSYKAWCKQLTMSLLTGVDSIVPLDRLRYEDMADWQSSVFTSTPDVEVSDLSDRSSDWYVEDDEYTEGSHEPDELSNPQHESDAL